MASFPACGRGMLMSNTPEVLLVETLDNGVTIEISDRSNRYFGDYNRIFLKVAIRIPVVRTHFADEQSFQAARTRLGETVLLERKLEAMGIASADIPQKRQQMIEGFLTSSRTYLARPVFPAKYLAEQLAKLKPAKRLTL